MLLSYAPPARAHDLGHRIPDGQNIDINYQNLTDAFRVTTDWNLNFNFHPRDFGTINVVVNSVREINVLDADYSPLTWSGLYDCVSLSSGVCSQANIHYNQNFPHTETARRWLGCHEFGHAWGIAHNTGGCMPGDQYNSSTVYGTHNTGHIDAWY